MDLQELAQVLPKNIVDWSVEDVAVWLKYIRLPQFQLKFRDRAIDGCMLLLMDQHQIRAVLQTNSRIINKKVANWIAFLNSHSRNYQSQVSRVVSRSSQQFQEEDNHELERQNTSVWTQPYHSQQLADGKRQKKDIFSSTQKQPYFHHEHLFVYERFGQFNHYYRCNLGKNMALGKSADNNIILNQQGVDLNHCIIYHRKSHHFIKASRGSGVWIMISKSLKIDRHFKIQMGNTQFLVAVDSKALRITVAQTNGNQVCTNYTFCHSRIGNIRIGRSSRYQLSFPTDSTMSGFHGRFSYVENDWYFEDMQTLNGSWYRCTEDLLISNKLVFRLGNTCFIYQCRLLNNQDALSVSSAKSKSVCHVCRNAEKNSYFNPCHHCVTCDRCAVGSQRCFECGWKIMSVERMFRT